MSSEQKDRTFTQYNSKAGWKNKIVQGLKANGETQLKEIGTQGDEMDALLELNVQTIINWDKILTEKGIKHVNPWINGKPPNNV